jgi:hypothetical protein
VFSQKHSLLLNTVSVLLFELHDEEKAEYYEVVFGVVRFTENVRQYDGYRE